MGAISRLPIGGGSGEHHFAIIHVSTDYLMGELVTCSCNTIEIPYSKTVNFDENGDAYFTVYDWGTYSVTADEKTRSVEVNEWFVTFEADISNVATIVLTLEGAKEDTISVYDADDNLVATSVFESGSCTGTANVPVPTTGSTSLKFISSVAKDTTSGTSDYSKTVTVTASTTEVKVMPDKALYWYGNNVANMRSSGLAVTSTQTYEEGITNFNDGNHINFSYTYVSTHNITATTICSADMTNYSTLKANVSATLNLNGKDAEAGICVYDTQYFNQDASRIIKKYVQSTSPRVTSFNGITSLDISSKSGEHNVHLYKYSENSSGSYGYINKNDIYALWLE